MVEEQGEDQQITGQLDGERSDRKLGITLFRRF